MLLERSTNVDNVDLNEILKKNGHFNNQDV